MLYFNHVKCISKFYLRNCFFLIIKRQPLYKITLKSHATYHCKLKLENDVSPLRILLHN